MFFPRNSFVTNSTLTHTSNPPLFHNVPQSYNHIVCYGGDATMAQVKWHNSHGPLNNCDIPCQSCGHRCINNGYVGEDPPVNGSSNIHLFNTSNAYVNQDLQCRVSGGQSAFIGVYLKNGGEQVSFMVRNTIYTFTICAQTNRHTLQLYCNRYICGRFIYGKVT